MEIELSLKMGIGAILLLTCGVGIGMLQCGSGSAKSTLGNAVNAVVAGLFSIAGFLSLGTVLFFNLDLAGELSLDPLDLWTGSPEVENITLAFWLSAFAAIFTILPLGVAAGRLKWSGVAIFSLLNGAVVLPVIGRWIWLSSVAMSPNQGWLEAMDFSDFGGVSLIGVGAGAAGLAIALAAGARQGKFSETNGRPFYLPAGNLPLALLGAVVIAIGWLGFAIGFPGPHSASSTFSEKILVLSVAVVSAAVASSIFYRLLFGALNALILVQSIIGGLVAGFACCSEVAAIPALAIGGVAGILVVFGAIFLEKIKLDDVSGVISAHLLCGIWGIIAGAIFGGEAWKTQLTAAAAIALSTGAAAFCLALFLKKLGVFLITKDQEKPGLDFVQHGITTRSGDE